MPPFPTPAALERTRGWRAVLFRATSPTGYVFTKGPCPAGTASPETGAEGPLHGVPHASAARGPPGGCGWPEDRPPARSAAKKTPAPRGGTGLQAWRELNLILSTRFSGRRQARPARSAGGAKGRRGAGADRDQEKAIAWDFKALLVWGRSTRRPDLGEPVDLRPQTGLQSDCRANSGVVFSCMTAMARFRRPNLGTTRPPAGRPATIPPGVPKL